MKQFFSFVVAVFSILFLVYVYRDDSKSVDYDSALKVYAPASFISSWGPGNELKSLFEKKTGHKIVFLEMKESSTTFQKLIIVGEAAIGDVVIGLDQYDLARSADKVQWKKIFSEKTLNLPASLNKIFQNEFFIPYDWAPIAFVARSQSSQQWTHKLTEMNDLLSPEFKNKIAYEDPRTSSPGLQFLLWVAQTKDEAQTIQFLKALNKNAHSFSSSWSTAYSLFKEKQVEAVLSYVTSPIYHYVEEKDNGFKAIEFKEGHPAQVEFAGLLASCQNCDIGNQFIHFLQSAEAQRIIMNKNYMLPVDKQVLEGTPFDSVRVFKLLEFNYPTKEEINKWIKLWVDIRTNEE